MNPERIHLYVWHAVIFIVLAMLSSIRLPTLMNFYEQDWSIALGYGVVALALLFAFRVLRGVGPIRLRMARADVLLIALLAYITGRRYIGEWEVYTSFSYYELFLLAGLYIAFRLTDQAVYRYFLLAVTAAAILQSVKGNLQLHGLVPSRHDFFRITGSFSNPGAYAGFLASIFPVSLGIFLFYVSSRSQLIRYCAVVACVLILIILPACQSRAAWLAVSSTSCIVLMLKYRSNETWRHLIKQLRQRKWVAIAMIALLSLSSISAYVWKQRSADGRLMIWKITASMIADRPIVGWGFDRFKAHYMSYQAEYFKMGGLTNRYHVEIADNTLYAFNDVLQFIAENGCIGLVIMCAVILTVVRRKNSNLSIILAKLGLLSIGVFSLFSYPSQVLPIKINAVLFLAIISSGNPGWDKWFLPTTGKLRVMRYAIGLAVIILGYLTCIYTTMLATGLRAWALAHHEYQQKNYQQAVLTYKKMNADFLTEGNVAAFYGKALSMANEHHEAIRVLTDNRQNINTTITASTLGDSFKAIGEYQKAADEYERAWHMAPAKLYTRYLLAKLYYETAQTEKAVQLATEVLNEKPKVQSPASEEIRREMRNILRATQSYRSAIPQ